MISALARLPAPALRLPGWLSRLRDVLSAGTGRGGSSVTAISLGPRPLAVRVSRPQQPQGRLAVSTVAPAAGELPAAVAAWRRAGLFAQGSAALLVLRSADRQLLTIDQPQVPEAELPLAVRWPLAEAMDCDAEALLATAVALPRINDAQRTQVLAVGARLEPVQQQLAQLRQAGLAVRSIDIVDSALRGMALLARHVAPPPRAGQEHAQVVLASVGRDLCVGLLHAARFCAVRTLALPAAPPRDAAGFEEQLALHLQRTTDGFERQATQLAVREVLAWLPTIEAGAREDVRRMLPLAAQWFEPAACFEMDESTSACLMDDDELMALACVAAARLLEPATSEARAEAPAAAEAQR